MYATHPVTVHHAPGWLGPLLIVLAVVLLAGAAVFAFEALNLRLLFMPKVEFTPSTQMVERHFQLEHQGDLAAGVLLPSQLRQVFLLEHEADMQ